MLSACHAVAARARHRGISSRPACETVTPHGLSPPTPLIRGSPEPLAAEPLPIYRQHIDDRSKKDRIQGVIMRGFDRPFEGRMRGPWRMPFPPPWGGGPGPGGHFGPGFPFGHGGPGPHTHGRGRRGRRANVRAALLALLLERPMHGYEMISELDSRTRGVWRPSPGSVYPTLQMLEDEGLIVSEESGGRRRFSLTDAGRAEAEAAGEQVPWAEFTDDTFATWHDVRDATFGAMNALRQVMTSGTDEQRQRAIEVIGEAKRKLYAILAE
jgi:DNA-binding PadR family transcriptional regulator